MKLQKRTFLIMIAIGIGLLSLVVLCLLPHWLTVKRLTDAAHERYETRVDSLKLLRFERRKEWPKRSLIYNIATNMYQKDLDIVEKLHQNELEWARQGKLPSTPLTHYEQDLLNLIDE